jgi:hypothetical protein
MNLLATIVKLLHVLSAFWFSTGLLGRGVTNGFLFVFIRGDGSTPPKDGDFVHRMCSWIKPWLWSETAR